MPPLLTRYDKGRYYSIQIDVAFETHTRLQRVQENLLRYWGDPD